MCMYRFSHDSLLWQLQHHRCILFVTDRINNLDLFVCRWAVLLRWISHLCCGMSRYSRTQEGVQFLASVRLVGSPSWQLQCNTSGSSSETGSRSPDCASPRWLEQSMHSTGRLPRMASLNQRPGLLHSGGRHLDGGDKAAALPPHSNVGLSVGCQRLRHRLEYRAGDPDVRDRRQQPAHGPSCRVIRYATGVCC